MRYQSLCLAMALSLLAQAVHAAEKAFENLPESGFILLESSVISDEDTHFASFHENGYLVVRSSLSPLWHKGIYFNLQNGRVTVPGVGVGNLKATPDGYTWNTQEKDVAFEKKGELTLKRLARGCELVWSFLVQSRGQRLVNEAGRLGYSCRSGAHDAALAQKQPVKTLPRPQDSAHPIINPEAPTPLALEKAPL
jgi:hypothetical protein